MEEYKVYDKQITIQVIELDENRIYDIKDVLIAVNDIIDNTEYSALRDYELEGRLDIYKWMVEKGWVNYCIGSRMARLYARNEDKLNELEEFRDYLYKKA